MAINKEKYIAKYVEEGFENISLVEGLIFDIKDGVSIEDDLATLLRALHTLKGSSRMLEFKCIEELTHSLESVFISFKEQRIELSGNAVKLILASIDLIKNGLTLVKDTKEDAVAIEKYVKNLNALSANEEFFLPQTEKKQPEETRQDQQTNAAPEKQLTEENTENPAENTPYKSVGKQYSKSESIRLSIDKIDNIIKSIASLQSLEIEAKNISLDSAALSSDIKEYSVRLKSDRTNNPALIANFRKLERLSERINTAFKNYSVDASNQIRSAYDTVISLRTLPLSTVLDSYPRYVYQLAEELGKKVQLTIEGSENEIDKNIIETLSEFFLHTVRNAVDHGLEKPDERLASGKDETGKLSIVCTRESGSMKIIVSDDGRGLNLDKIRQKAIREGLITEASSVSVSKEELFSFIFYSGFSTSGTVSNVSGRGVGMDIVRESIEALKGSIIVDSTPGKGTSFTIIVPLSIAALVGFPIASGGMNFIIPATFVETTMLVNPNDIITVIDRPELKYNGQLIKLYYLKQVLQIKTETAGSADTIFVVIIRGYDEIAALVVDDITNMRSVILKTIPSFMEKISVFSGIVLNDDYEMVSVLHIPSVIKIAKRIKTIDLKKRNVEFEKLKKSILVVDDSRPTREIESEILSAEGYIVDTAADGAEALKAAKAKNYDLICTDIQMPVMDGFMLTENIKKNEDLSHIPIIIISSRDSEEDKKRAAMLGASRYIVKSSFNTHNLLEAVKDLIGGINE